MNNLVTNTLTKISINHLFVLFTYLFIWFQPPGQNQTKTKARIPFNSLQYSCFQQGSHCHDNISLVIISTILILELFPILEMFF